jgi:hypothetical protein
MSNDKVQNAKLAAVWTPHEEQAPHGTAYITHALSNNATRESGPFAGSRPKQPGRSEFLISPAGLPSKDDVIGGKRRGDPPSPLPLRPQPHDRRPNFFVSTKGLGWSQLRTEIFHSTRTQRGQGPAKLSRASAYRCLTLRRYQVPGR